MTLPVDARGASGIALLDGKDGRMLARVPSAAFRSAAFSPDGRTVWLVGSSFVAAYAISP